jgi:DhnA family fructose-bisphosphate aldolase class Ia
VLVDSDRSTIVLRNLPWLLLSGTGYVSILPVDQGIEHSAAASFAPNPLYFDPGNLVRLAVEGGCNAFASRPHRYQIANCHMGRSPLINSGGASAGDGDLAEAVRTAVVDKRAGRAASDLGAQGVPAPAAGGHRPAERDPGRLPVARRHDCVGTRAAS